MTGQLHFEVAGVGCELAVPHDVATEVRPILAPYLTTRRGPSRLRIRRASLISCEAAARHERRRSHPWQEYDVCHCSADVALFRPLRSGTHLISRRPGVIEIHAPDRGEEITLLRRILRQVIVRLTTMAGGLLVHAAIVDIGGDGVGIAGPAGSGKSSLLLRLVSEHAAHPVANDQALLVVAPGDTAVTAVGIPLAWRMTPATVRTSAALKHLLSGSPTRGADLVTGKYEFDHFEATRALGAKVVHSTRLRSLWLPRRAGHTLAAWLPLREALAPDSDDSLTLDWLHLGTDPSLRPGPRPGSTDPRDLLPDVPIRHVTWSAPEGLSILAADIAAQRIGAPS